MKKNSLFLIVIALFFTGLVACSNNLSALKDTKVEENFLKSGSDNSNYVELSKLNDNFWVHTTYTDYNGYRTPSNGLLVVTSKGLLLVDTPWNNDQTKELIGFAKNTFNKDFTMAIITHAHDDRIGGIDTLLENKIDVRSTRLTVKEAEKNGYKKPEPKLDFDSKIKVGNIDVEILYPGEGHSPDNITVWFPQSKVLFGGCLIKSLDSKDLGSMTDSNLEVWPSSVKMVLDKYSEAEVVVPGHGKWGSLDLVRHTLELLKNK